MAMDESTLSNSDRDLLAKARASYNKLDVAAFNKFVDAASPPVIIDLLTRLAAAQAEIRRLEDQDRQSERFCKELVVRCAAGLNALAARSPAAGEGVRAALDGAEQPLTGADQ